MEEKQLNEKESLELIARMIQNTQRKFEKVHALPFLVFGYMAVVSSLAVWYALKTTQDPLWNFLWLSIPVLGYPILYLLRKNRPKMVRTYIDNSVNYVWLVCGVTVIAASFIPTFHYKIPILFIVLLLMSIATAITGAITKMRLILASGILGIVASFLMVSYVGTILNGLDQILYFGAVFLVMMVIPGHILYYKGKKR